MYDEISVGSAFCSVMEISKAKLSVYSSLNNVKMRRKYGLFSVEGEKSVIDLVDIFQLEAIIRVNDYKIPDIIADISKVYEVSDYQMKQLSNFSTPSQVMAIFKTPACEDTVDLDENELCVALDGIQDPGNLGTIIRTCHWFGIRRIFASKNTVDLYNPKTVQATMGSLGKVRVTYCELAELFNSFSSMPVYGMLLDGRNIFEAPLQKRGFILLGNEGSGISAELRSKISHPLLIPPGNSDHSESLNVAIAGAITISCFARLKY